MEEVIVKVEDLTIAYHDKPVLKDCDIDIMTGSVTAVIGPNGAGKSTLIRGYWDFKISLQVRFLSWESPLKKSRRK